MENQTEVEKYNSSTTIIFYAMFAAQAIFLSIAAFLLKNSGPLSSSFGPVFRIILPVVTLASVAGSIFIPRIILGSVSELGEKEKLIKYRTSSLVKWAMIEGGNIFAIVIYLNTGWMLALMISILMLMLFIFNRPSLDRMKSDLGL